MQTAVRRRLRISTQADEKSLGRRHRPDYWLIIICLTLIVIGVIVVYAIGPALSATTHLSPAYYTSRQLIAVFLSVIAFIVTSLMPISRWKTLYKPLIILALPATMLAIVLPVNPAYPAHRWVRLGSLSFQSVELVKFAVIMWTAAFLAKALQSNLITDFNKTLKPLVIAIVIVGLLVAGVQSDLGSMGVIVAIMASMAFIAGLPLKRVLLVLAIIAIGLILAISAIPYRRARLESYLHPQSNCQGSGYQACQAIIAVGSGGVFGLGLGRSVQAYGYEPESSNDSIFAIYAETFGFLGSTILVIIFAALFKRMKFIAERISDDFSKFIVIGLLAWISAQTIINIGAMVGLLPLKGITLPFVSYGGTSIVFLAAAMGIVFQISRYTSYQPLVQNSENNRRPDDDNRFNGRRLRGAYHPNPSGS
jgi:cell division protein FtsW